MSPSENRLSESTNRSSLKSIVFTFALVRLLINMTRRFSYPFIPAIADQLSVDTVVVQRIVALQVGAGLASPLLLNAMKRVNPKSCILISLAVLTIGSIISAIYLNVWLFLITMMLIGLAKSIYDPVMQAYIGLTVNYYRRGWAIGFTEISWALSLALVAPLTSYILTLHSIRELFALFTLGSVGSIVLIVIIVPSLHVEDEPNSLELSSQKLLFDSHLLIAISFSFLITMADEMFIINYSSWLVEKFQISTSELGVVIVIVAIAETCGSIIVILWSDKLGKRMLVLAGTLTSSIIYLCLLYLNSNLILLALGLFFLFSSLEMAIVSSISIFTELATAQRSIFMSYNLFAHQAGRLSGAFLGGVVYQIADKFDIIIISSALITLAAFCIISFGTRE